MQLLITAQDIKTAHPIALNCLTDLDYAKVGNKLLRRIRKMHLPKEITGEMMKKMALKVTLYFEDIICDCGIWRSFVEKHHELYGQWLPFYDITEEYYADEPHIQDIAVLIWDCLLEELDGEIIVPHSPYLLQVAREFYEVLEDEFEKIPINEELKAYFEEAPFLDDFITLRFILQWVYGFCYLTTGYGTADAVDDECEIVSSVLRLDEDDDRVLYAAMSQVCVKVKVGMLALLPQEWLALILERNSQKEAAKKVRQLEYHSYDLYKMTKHDDEYLYLRDTCGKDIKVRIDDYQNMNVDILAETDGCVASFVKYRREWHINGIDTWGKLGKAYEAEYERKRRYKSGIPQKTYDSLMKKSGGSPLFYFRNGWELRKFTIEELGVPEHLVKSSEMDSKEYLVLWIPSANTNFSIAPDAALSIRDPRNPYFHAKKDQGGAFGLLIEGNRMPGDMIRYLIDHDMLPDLEEDFDFGPGDMRSKLDFFARALRRDEY